MLSHGFESGKFKFVGRMEVLLQFSILHHFLVFHVISEAMKIV